jgi:hypothetical protein
VRRLLLYSENECKRFLKGFNTITKEIYQAQNAGYPSILVGRFLQTKNALHIRNSTKHRDD